MRLQVEITTASLTSGPSVSRRAKSTAPDSVTAKRSRSATGAVLCEMPSASSSPARLPATREEGGPSGGAAPGGVPFAALIPDRLPAPHPGGCP